MSLRQHRKQPCHGAFISRRGEVAYVCTDRSRHAGEVGSGVLDLKAERAAKRAVVKELREVQPVRAAALKDALANGAIGTDEAVRKMDPQRGGERETRLELATLTLAK
ncbi:MAG: hypothetical protein M3019_04320 [Candidatus Dormibacteraeota bacterium]|nr:hypothetical protein [Candidatus Dormibacteraeota bacterium]